MDPSTQSPQTYPWNDMEDEYLITLVLHTYLGWKHMAHFLNAKFEREFTGEECASRYEALELHAKVQAAYQIRTGCGLKQENGKDDWTSEMDRVLCVLVLRKANNRRGKGSYSWSRIDDKLNDVLCPTERLSIWRPCRSA